MVFEYRFVYVKHDGKFSLAKYKQAYFRYFILVCFSICIKTHKIMVRPDFTKV